MIDDRAVYTRELHGCFISTNVAQLCRFLLFRRFMRICAVSRSLFNRLHSFHKRVHDI